MGKRDRGRERGKQAVREKAQKEEGREGIREREWGERERGIEGGRDGNRQ